MVSVEYKPQLLEDGIAAYMQNHPEKTLGTLAKEAGISEGHLSRMWHGKIVPPRVKIVTLKRIALALGQDPARYYTEPNPASEPADIGQVVAGVFAYDMPNRQTYFGKPDNGTLRDACHVSTRGLSQSPFSPVEARRRVYYLRAKASTVDTFDFNPGGAIATYSLEDKIAQTH